VPPPALTLENDEIHLWQTNLERATEAVEQLSATLSTEERARAERFYFPQHRQRFTVARAILRRILGQYLGIAPERVEFAYNLRGKPELTANCGLWLQFNLSHCEGLALYGVTRERRIGVDLEKLRPVEDLEKLVERFYSAAEFRIISHLPPEARRIAFFRGWTAKEAYLKATGEGLAGGLEQVEVSLTAGKPLRLLKLPGNAPVSGWSLFSPDVHPDYMAAVAVEGSELRLRYWQVC
jgi:4'-phosphopantetheinyl transferase